MPVDVFHVTNYGSVPMDCAVVTTLFDAIPFVDPAMANPRLRQLKNFILRRSAEHADHVIAISNYAIPELVEHYRVPESKITVVYCGVDNDWIDHQPTQDRVDEVLTHHQLERGYFLTVGTLQPRKNVERLLEAHSRLPERKERPLVVVGKRGWNCEALVAKLEEKIALGEARWLSDVTSRDDLKCLYAGAEAFLFPSLFEGFGLPILEAFAMGLPVLTSNTTSLPEVSQGIGIEIDPLNLDQMVEGMQQLLNLRDREARIQAGRARAMDLTWNRCALETLEVYRKVLAAR
jgi:alpha-1,3-rhamnosyl/mannosyltransferase